MTESAGLTASSDSSAKAICLPPAGPDAFRLSTTIRDDAYSLCSPVPAVTDPPRVGKPRTLHRQRHITRLDNLSVNSKDVTPKPGAVVSKPRKTASKPRLPKNFSRDKRKAELEENSAAKKARYDCNNPGYVPKFRDWRCKKCCFWNRPYDMHCRGRAEHPNHYNTCMAERSEYMWYNQARDGVAREDPESKFIGDWWCGACRRCNAHYLEECFSECGYGKSNMIGEVRAGPDKVHRSRTTGANGSCALAQSHQVGPVERKESLPGLWARRSVGNSMRKWVGVFGELQYHMYNDQSGAKQGRVAPIVWKQRMEGWSKSVISATIAMQLDM